MALSSDDWPRFSLLVGASTAHERSIDSNTSGSSCHLRPASDQIARELLDAACSEDMSSTWECWLQLRAPTKSRRESLLQLSEREIKSGDGVRVVCWIVRTPAWSCGVDSDGACVALVGSMWYTSTAATRATPRETPHTEMAFQLATGRWYHFAGKSRRCLFEPGLAGCWTGVLTQLALICVVVRRNPKSPALELFIDGRSLHLSTYSSKTNPVGFIGGRDTGFLIGVAASQTSACVTCVVHDFRVWRCALDESKLSTYVCVSITSTHKQKWLTVILHSRSAAGSTNQFPSRTRTSRVCSRTGGSQAVLRPKLSSI